MILATNRLASNADYSLSGPGAARYWVESAGLLDELESAMRSATTVGGVLGQAAEYHLHGGGKRLRGRIALAVGLSLGLEAEQILPAAAAVEILHAASLVHDDMQDRDRLRRGREAVWSRFGKDTALLLGDTLIGAAFAEAARSPRASVAAVAAAMSKCIGRLAEGQRRDVAPARPRAWSPQDYEWLARRKTGRLVALAAELPLIIAGEPEAVRRFSNRSLEWLGVAYQIQDDLADLVGAKGRERGSDIRTGKMSAVLVHFVGLTSAQEGMALTEEIERAQRSGGSGSAERVDDVLASRAVPASLLQQRAALRRADRHARRLPEGLRRTVSDVGRRVSQESFALVGPALHDGHSINRLDRVFEEDQRDYGQRLRRA